MIGSAVEGEAIAYFMAELLRSKPNYRLTRIAQSLPTSGGLEDHTDDSQHQGTPRRDGAMFGHRS